MTNVEQAVRDAAKDFRKAIKDAEAAGFHVAWPSRADGLDGIAISETKKKVSTVEVKVSADVGPVAVEKAALSAQKAADKVIDKAAG